MSKKVLAWVSDHPLFRHVGQSRLTREFLSRLINHYEIICVGFNDPEGDFRLSVSLPYKTVSVKRTGEGPAKDDLVKHLADIKPDITVLSHDPFLFFNIDAIRPHTKQLVGYYTIDGHPVPRVWYKTIYLCDKVITPSQYGQRVLKERFIDKPVHVVPYGVEKSFFMNPKAPKEEWKKQIENSTIKTRAHIDSVGKFMAIFWGHFQGKKNLTPAFMAWEKFTRNKPDTLFLCMGHIVPTSYNGWTYEGEYDLADFLEIPNVIAFSGITGDEFLRPAIWASDILLFCGFGEGFGLPNVEAMAGRCLPISTHFAAPTDYLTKDNSFPLYRWNPVAGAFGVIRAVVDPNEILQHLEKAYSMWKRKDPALETMRDQAQHTASLYNWDRAAEDMKRILDAEIPSKYELVRV
jgi:glycosyltransferase involved in cell wall biosynthesis